MKPRSLSLLAALSVATLALAGSAHAQAYNTVSQTITDTPGQTLTLTYFLFSDGDTPNFFSANLNGTTTFISVTDLAAQPYTEYTDVFTSTGSDTINFEEMNAPGFFGLDDVSVTDASNNQYITNGGFETGNFTGWTVAIPGDVFTFVGSSASVDNAVDAVPYDGNYFAALGYVEPSPVTATPEPSSLVLLGTGILSVAGAARRKFRKA